jgi:hypothetical protein
MDSLMESIFLISGHIVSYTNGVIAIILIGFLPLYIFFFICYKNKIALKSILPIIFLSLASVFSLCLIAVVAMTAVALGAWG